MIDDPPYFCSVCSSLEIDDDETREEFMMEMLNKDFPDFLRWADIHADPEEPEEFEIIVSTGRPEVPDQGPSHTAFRISSEEEESKFHIHSFIERKYYSDMVYLHNSLASSRRSLKVNHSSISVELSADFEEVVEDINKPGESEVLGLEYVSEKGRTTIFRDENGEFISIYSTEESEDVDDIEEPLLTAKSMADEAKDAGQL
jgi:hypothetical protein